MEPLKDPKKDRAVKTVKAPPSAPLTSELLWDKPKNPSKLTRHP